VLKKKNNKPALLGYWTTRYLITLIVGLIIIGIVSTLWIKNSTIKKRLDIMKIFAAEVADRVVNNEGKISINPHVLLKVIDRREKFLQLGPFSLFVLDEKGKVLFSAPKIPKNELMQKIDFPLEKQGVNEKVIGNYNEGFYIVKSEIKNNDQEMLGWVMILSRERDIIRNPEELKFLGIMLGGLALLGWGVIYLLTRKLSQPIQDVANASKQIVKGNYDIKLDKNVKEKEIYELINSFEQMVERLKKLESLRTELLAGITHELKTPVTSISALIQAVREGVVSGEEAKDFLGICSDETNRLQKMIEDLLDFNSFAVGAIKVQIEKLNLNKLIQEITYQWYIGQDDDSIKIKTWLPETPIFIETDPMRVRQILYNLFNNAKQAFDSKGKIDVILYKNGKEIRVDVKDNGRGIPQEEEDLIFERFYRGKNKTHKIRGLGLGLPFSKMIAKALGGDLVLKKSSAKGTTFTLILY
jgi:signal transduction histidine kinase